MYKPKTKEEYEKIKEYLPWVNMTEIFKKLTHEEILAMDDNLLREISETTGNSILAIYGKPLALKFYLYNPAGIYEKK